VTDTSEEAQEIERLIIDVAKSYVGKVDRSQEEIEAMQRDVVEHLLFQGKSLTFIKMVLQASFYK
jgi:DNA-directed RNA polymerase alpha subunit